MAYQENEIFASRYKLVKKLGVGGFSEVWLAQDSLTDDSEIAIKIYAPNGGLDNQGLKVFSKEYALLQDINNQFLLKAMHFDINDDMPYLVLPYCPNGSLLGQLHEKGNFSEDELAKVIFEVGTGLAYLHQNGIIHQDIKPANILINRRNEYVISDFGISNNVRRTLRKSMGVASSSMSPEYAPPERFSSNPQTLPAGDVFSFGVLLYEMATGDVPWMGMGGMSLSRGAEIPAMPEQFSNNFKKWTTACLSVNPAERPSAADFAKAAETFVNEGYWPPYKPAVSAAPSGSSASSARKTVAKVDLDDMAARIDENLAKKQAEPKAAPKGNATMKDGGAKPPKAQKKKKSPVLLIVIVLVVLIGGGGGAYWFMEQQKVKNFDKAFAVASAFALDSNWLEAHKGVVEALEIIPDNAEALAMKENALNEMKKKVTSEIKKADALADDENFTGAMNHLDQLALYLNLFPEIDDARAKYQEKAEAQREKQFVGMLAKGDEYMSKLIYAKAAEYYGRADSLKPGDSRVQTKLDAIGTKLKELYNGEVAKGDSYMQAKNHAAAVSAYSRAVLYDKSNSDGQDKLAKAKESLERDKKLLAAAESGDVGAVKSLLSAGANPNYGYNYKYPTGWAVYNANLDMLKALKDAGASCNPEIDYYYSGTYSYSLISLAALVNNVDVFKYLHTTCRADVSNVYDYVKDGAIKEYMKGLGYGGVEYTDYFSSSSSSHFPAETDAYREWSFRDGKYYMRCISQDYAGWQGEVFDIDVNADWEMSVDVHHVSGNTANGGVGLIFACEESYDYVNVFGVTPSGKYHIGYYEGSWQTEYPESSKVNQGTSTNTLRIVKRGTTVYYYINGTYITAKYNVKMAGKMFGLYYGSPDGYTTVYFDNFVLKSI
ncbi:protein kinase [bacterium]|nr:protein kinase [bacterium]